MSGPPLLNLVGSFAAMPTEEFLALLVKSKAAGASTMIPSIGVESGPEVVSKELVSPSVAVGTGVSEAAAAKDRDKKRHRDGHSSKGHHSKKLKEPLSCPSSGKVDLFPDDTTESSPRVKANTEVYGLSTGGGLHVCKRLVEKLSVEFGKLLELGGVVDVAEVEGLRSEAKDLNKRNGELEEASQNLAKDNKTAADRLFAALTEKSELITECDALGEQVKSLKLENVDLKKAVKTSEENLVKGVEAWAAERAEFITKLDALAAQLVKCQAESLSSFEEGYGESVARFARFGIDVKDHGFDRYLADLAKKNEDGKTGSSEVGCAP